MSRLRVAPIVEGHGEVAAIRILLKRIWREIVCGEYVDILRPVRIPRSKLVKRIAGEDRARPNEQELERAVRLASLKLQAKAEPTMPALILVLIDANSDCPKELAPEVADACARSAGAYGSACVLANVEYESWFVAAAESLSEFLELAPERGIPEDPEGSRCGKAWIQKRFKATKYSETVDQPRLSAAMDLTLCRRRSPSFDKLCRELESRCRAT